MRNKPAYIFDVRMDMLHREMVVSLAKSFVPLAQRHPYTVNTVEVCGKPNKIYELELPNLQLCSCLYQEPQSKLPSKLPSGLRLLKTSRTSRRPTLLPKHIILRLYRTSTRKRSIIARLEWDQVTFFKTNFTFVSKPCSFVTQICAKRPATQFDT